MNDVVHVPCLLWVSFLICKVKVFYYRMSSKSLFWSNLHAPGICEAEDIFFWSGFYGLLRFGIPLLWTQFNVLENLSWLDVTRRIVDIWLFHWKTALAIKPISEWKYTRSGHYFSSYGDNDSFQSHVDFTAAPMTLFLPAVVDLLIPVMVWGTCVF